MYSDVHELNYSKIKTYLECPLLYKYKYMDGRKEGLVPASSLGVSIHRALEEYHRNSNDPSEILAYYDDCWLGAGYKSAGEQMEYYLKGQKMLERYAEHEYERTSTVDSTEREFIFQEGKWTIRGKIDRTDKHTDGTWEVIDYKTGEDIDFEAKITDSLQLGIYAVGAQRAWNLKKGKASFYFTAFDKKESANFEDFDEKAILAKFIEVGEKIEAGLFEPDLSHCQHCAFRNRCEKSSCPDPEPEGPDFSGNNPA